MEFVIEKDATRRSINKFYARIRSHLDDLSLQGPEKATPVSDKLQDISEEDKYGFIKPENLNILLEAYDRQPNKPLRCDDFEAGNLARMLFSKAGFHNPSSTDYLVEDLKINDVNRNSFLGGHSTYVNYIIGKENKLGFLRECQRKMFLSERVKQIMGEIESALETQPILTPDMENEINGLISSGPNNSDVKILIGKRLIIQRRFDQAINELETALDNDCTNFELAKQSLSVALFQKGYKLYQGGEYEQASNCFNKSLEKNPDHKGSKLHLSLVQEKMMEQAPRRFGTINPNKSHQRRR